VNKIDVACNTHEYGDKCIQNFSRKGRDHSEGIGEGERIKLKWILENTLQKCRVDSSGPG